MNFVPNVIERTEFGERAMDIYSTLLKDRIVMASGGIDDNVASSITSQLLYLEAQDPEADIHMYINSPGGVVTSGLAIYDTMNLITPDVVTICVGQAASMGALLLSSGAKGKRYALPSSRIMIHQPLGGSQGQATDIEIQAREILRMKGYLNGIMAEQTGKTIHEIQKDTERDNFMIAEEALEYGIVDHVLKNREILKSAS